MLNYKVVVDVIADDLNSDKSYVCRTEYTFDKAVHRGFLSHQVEFNKNQIEQAYLEDLKKEKPRLRLVK